MEASNAAVKQTLLSTAMLAIMMAVFYFSAGRTDIPQSWFLFSMIFVYFTASNIFLHKTNPELLIHRLKKRRRGSKAWDEVLMRVSNLTALLLMPMVVGLDIGRFRWSSLGLAYAVLGFILFVASSMLLNWAMAVNPYFEPTVRIQGDRDHHVVSTGPYAVIRHPGYLSGIIWMASIPLIMGSAVAIAPFALYTALYVIRTYLEDSTLKKELFGYTEYTQKVRYRLFLGIW